MFERELRKALRSARRRGLIDDRELAATARPDDLPRPKRDRYWIAAEARVASLCGPRAQRDFAGLIDWRKLRAWLREHAVQIVQILVALLPLFI